MVSAWRTNVVRDAASSRLVLALPTFFPNATRTETLGSRTETFCTTWLLAKRSVDDSPSPKLTKVCSAVAADRMVSTMRRNVDSEASFRDICTLQEQSQNPIGRFGETRIRSPRTVMTAFS